MDRLLTCTCGREHVVARSQAGQTLQCACGQTLAIPTLRGLNELPVANPAISTATDAPYRETRIPTEASSTGAWQGWRGPAMALATMGFLIALSACGWYGWNRFTIDTSYTVDTEIANGHQLFDSYDANTLSLIWHDFGKMGLRTKQPPAFYLWYLYAQELQQKMLVSGGIAAAFGAAAVAIAFSAKRS